MEEWMEKIFSCVWASNNDGKMGESKDTGTHTAGWREAGVSKHHCRATRARYLKYVDDTVKEGWEKKRRREEGDGQRSHSLCPSCLLQDATKSNCSKKQIANLLHLPTPGVFKHN